MKIKTFIMSLVFFALLTLGVYGCYAINAQASTYTVFIQTLIHTFYIIMFVLALSGSMSFLSAIGSEYLAIKITAIILTLGLIAEAIIIILKYKEFLNLI